MKDSSKFKELISLAFSSLRELEYGSARKYVEEAVAIHEKAITPHTAEEAEDQELLGILLHYLGNLDTSQLYLERALYINEKILAPEHIIAQNLSELGRLFYSMEDLEKARFYLERALTINEKILEPVLPTLAQNYLDLGRLFYKMEELNEAYTYLERALAIYEKVYGLNHVTVAQCLPSLARVLEGKGDVYGAIHCLERAIPILTSVLDNHIYLRPEIANSMNLLGELWYKLGQLKEASSHFKSSRNIIGVHPISVKANFNLGYLLYSMGRLDDALSEYKNTLSMCYELYGSQDTLTVANCLIEIGKLLRVKGELNEALAYYERALIINQRILGDIHPQTARCLNKIGMLLLAQGKIDRAQPYLNHSNQIFRTFDVNTKAVVAMGLAGIGNMNIVESFLIAQRFIENGEPVGYAIARIKNYFTDNLLVVGNHYLVEAGINSLLPESYSGKPLFLPEQYNTLFHILIYADDMVVESDRIQPFLYQHDRETPLVEFVVRPIQSGAKHIWVEFLYENHWLTKIDLEVNVIHAEAVLNR